MPLIKQLFRLPLRSPFASVLCHLFPAPVLPLRYYATPPSKISPRDAQLKLEKSADNVSSTLVPPRPQNPWTAERLELLWKLRSENISYRECARIFREQMGLDTTGAVLKDIVCRYKCLDSEGPTKKYPIRRWTSSELATLSRYRAEGLPYREISYMLNRSSASCKSQMRELRTGSDFRKGRLSLDEIELLGTQVQKYTKEGERPNWTEIGKLMKRTRQTVVAAWECHFFVGKTGEWTDEEHKKLLALVGTHKNPLIPWRTIALEMDRARTNVASKWRKLQRQGKVKNSAT
ncbi:hypothetical protein DFJ77DRAFT_508923 [Powellomyces hirtus]|nr:hypothetical protein DFJ77DRAFT_508923 [Powellomyces hirtus]